MIGGISSWLSIYMKCFPNHELITFTIGAREADKGKFACKIPDNMKHVEEVFLDSPSKNRGSGLTRCLIKSDSQKQVLINHFSGRNSDWPAIFEFAASVKADRIIDFFNSTDFFEIVQAVYEENYSCAPYNHFLWTIRSMYINQFYLLSINAPEADIYHSVLAGFPGMLASKASYTTGKPFVLTEHGIYTREREEEIIKSAYIKGYVKELWVKYFRAMSSCAYSFASKIITQFERNRDIQIELGADRKKTLIIPNGLNVEDYNFSYDERLYGDGVVVGSIARVVPIKDIITMVRSFEKSKKSVPEIKLVIVGPTEEDREYHLYVREYVRSRDIKDIIFTGKVDYNIYLQSLYSMDIFLLTSISEGQPISILEAMSCSKPVVSTDVGSCSELILGNGDGIGEAGIVAPVMDTDAIANAIISLAKDKSLRKKMGEAGRKRVSEFYTIKYMGDSYQKIYDEVAGSTAAV